ncbi:MAG: hypothetical protein V7742_09735 [Halioglobus sp.]
MRKLNLSQWTNLVELATGIVVIVTLVFVGIEIRQNTAAIKMESYQTAIDKLDARSYLLATDTGMHRLAKLAEESRSELTGDEWSRFVYFELPHLSVWEFIYDAHLKDSIDWHQWQGFERYFLSHYCSPNSPMRAVYSENITIWSDPFAQHIADVEKTKCKPA